MPVASPDVGSVESPGDDRAAQSFVEDLFPVRERRARSGRPGSDHGAGGGFGTSVELTHEVKLETDSLVLARTAPLI